MKYYKWISYATACSVLLGLAVTVVVLVMYGVNLGDVSSKAEDWGSFGSILSGAFTLLGAVTTFGTLVFLLVQQRKNDDHQREQETQRQILQAKHDEVISRQLEAQTFEQYLKHREVFFDRLESLEATFSNTIRFTNKDALYQRIFPDNCPTHCCYNIDLSEAGASLSELRQLRERVLELRQCIRLRPMQDGQGYSIIEKMWRIRDTLFIAYQQSSVDGDVSLGGVGLGINIYSLRESLEVIMLAVNSILFYSGNKEIEPFEGALKELSLRRAIVAESLSFRFSGHSFRVQKGTPGLVEMELFYAEVLQLQLTSRSAALEECHRILDRLFGSRQEIGKLREYSFFDAFRGEIRGQLNSLYKELEKREESVEAVLACFRALDKAWSVSFRAFQAQKGS